MSLAGSLDRFDIAPSASLGLAGGNLVDDLAARSRNARTFSPAGPRKRPFRQGSSQRDLHLPPIVDSEGIGLETGSPEFETPFDRLPESRSVSGMDLVRRRDHMAVRPLDDKEEKCPVPFPDPVDKIGEMADGSFRDRIGKKGSVSLPIGDTLDLHIDRPAFFIPVEVVDAASLTVGNLGAGVNPPGGEIRNLSGEQIPGQTIGPVGVDPHADSGKRLRLLRPEAEPSGFFGIDGKSGQKERRPRPVETAREPARVGAVGPDFGGTIRCYTIGKNGESLLPSPEDSLKESGFIVHGWRESLSKETLMRIRIARIYGSPTVETGEIPLLVDRLWPRGFRKDAISGLRWMKDWAPSASLRTWFHSHPEEFGSFRERYLAELEEARSRIEGDLRSLWQKEGSGSSRRLLLLYGAKDPERNNAAVLRDYLASIERPRPIP